MTRDQLKKRITGHNRFLVVVGTLLVPTSIMLWFLSYWVVKAMISIPLMQFRLFDWLPYAGYVAWGTMVVLAIEGVRYSIQRRDQQAYGDTAYFDNFAARSNTSRGLTPHYGSPFATAFLVSRLLFLAPISTGEIFSTFRSRLPDDDQTIDHATDILGELKEDREWIPAEHFARFGGGLMLLSKMKLIWVENRVGEIEVRIPPGS